MPQHVPLRHDCPYRSHSTAFTRHFWKEIKATAIKVGDTVVAAAGLGKVVAIHRHKDGHIECSVTGGTGKPRASGSPLTYGPYDKAYLHDDKKCRCEDD